MIFAILNEINGVYNLFFTFLAGWLGVIIFAVGISSAFWLANLVCGWIVEKNFGVFLWMLFCISIIVPLIFLSAFAGLSTFFFLSGVPT
jgi:hypothetical protein